MPQIPLEKLEIVSYKLLKPLAAAPKGIPRCTINLGLIMPQYRVSKGKRVGNLCFKSANAHSRFGHLRFINCVCSPSKKVHKLFPRRGFTLWANFIFMGKLSPLPSMNINGADYSSQIFIDPERKSKGRKTSSPRYFFILHTATFNMPTQVYPPVFPTCLTLSCFPALKSSKYCL